MDLYIANSMTKNVSVEKIALSGTDQYCQAVSC